MSSCPPSEQLRKVLSEALSPTDQGAVETHVESCPACKQQLELLCREGMAEDLGLTSIPSPAARIEPRPDFLRGLVAQLQPYTVGRVVPEVVSDPGPRYRILYPHDAGGLGRVFAAHDEEVNRQVALKEIQPELAHDAEMQTRFLAEAEITGKLEHPGIVPVYGLGRYADGRPFYATRFIQGESLRTASERLHQAGEPDALEFRRLLARFVEACNTIAYAHSRGILHRDLKPEHVMLGPFGETFVVDWGLAKPLQQGADGAAKGEGPGPVALSHAVETLNGGIAGTPGYMSPEQAAGRSRKLAGTSDVYSLGATLYYLLTGRPPFPPGADLLAQLQRVIRGELLAPRQAKRTVPAALEAICLKAMATRPADRYPSPRALAEDIERWLADEPVAVYRDPLPVRLRRWARRHKTLVAALTALAVVVTTVAVAWRLITGAQEQAREQTRIAGEMRALRNEALRQKERARAFQYVADLNLAHRAWESNQVPLMLELLERHRGRDPEGAHLRGFEWAYLWQLCHAERFNLRGHTSVVSCVAFSPDGKRLASGSWDRTIKIWDTATGEEILSLPGHVSTVTSVAFDPDGRRLVSGDLVGKIKVWDLATRRAVLTLPTNPVARVVFLPDGKRFAVVGEDAVTTVWTVAVWDAAGGKPLLTFKGKTSGSHCAAFSPDGKRVAVGNDDQTVEVWDLTTGKSVKTLWAATRPVVSVAFSPDGRYLASGGGTGPVQVWNTGTWAKVFSWPGHPKDVWSVGFSPDGQQVLIGCGDATIRRFDIVTGQERRPLRGHTGLVRCLAASPDGRRVASGSADKTVKVWDLSAGQEARILQAPVPRAKDSVTSVVFSPDGKQLAASIWRLAPRGKDRGIKVWDAASGGEIALALPGQDPSAVSVAFSPQGGRLAVSSEDGGVKVWDLKTGKGPLTLPGLKEGFGKVAFSPDGRRLAFAGRDTVKVWELDAAGEPRTLPGAQGPLAFTLDGTRLVTGAAGRTLKVWDLATGREVLTLGKNECPVHSMAIHPDGKRLVAIGGRGINQPIEVKVWDLATGQGQPLLTGAASPVSSVAFSPDGRRLALGDDEGTVRFLDLATQQTVLTLTAGKHSVEGLAFSPDGRRLAAGCVDGTVKVWDAPGLDR